MMTITSLNIYFIVEGGKRLHQSYEVTEESHLQKIQVEHRDDIYRVVFDYKSGTQRVTMFPKSAVVIEYAAIHSNEE